MKRTCLKYFVACVALSVASFGCSTTTSTSGQASSNTSGESATADEAQNNQPPEGESADDEGGESGSGQVSAQLPEGIDMPDGCPDIVKISLPEEELTKQELRTWLCGRIEQTGTPSWDQVKGSTFEGACTLESTGRQGATNNVQTEVSCYDPEGRKLALLSLSNGDIKFVRRYEYDGGDEPVVSVSGDAQSCSITRRKGDKEYYFRAEQGDDVRLLTEKTFDEEGRLVREVSHNPSGTNSVGRIEYTSSENKRVKTTYNGDQKQSETVEFLRDDGSVERKVESFYSNGAPSFGTETHYDEQERKTKVGPVDTEGKRSYTVTIFEYRGDHQAPISKQVVSTQQGKEPTSATVTYELNDNGDPVSSTITLPSGESMSESWSYEDGKLAESHTFQSIDPSGRMMRKEHVEIRYDDQGRPVYHHRWTGEKDGRTYAGHESEMTYECLE